MDSFGFPVSALPSKMDQDRCASITSGQNDHNTILEKPRTSSSATLTTTKPSTNTLSGPQPPPPTPSNGNFFNPVVMSFIRDDWIQQQLHLRQSAYTTYQKTTILTGTWNVNAKKPFSSSESSKILSWLHPVHPVNQPSPDIMALAFQEIVDLNAVNVVVNNQSAQRSSQWEDAILTALNQHTASSNQYKLILSRALVGILLIVIAKVEHVEHIREVYGATAGVGLMGMMGNKGGAAIRLSFYDTTLCFVSAHLAAHRENTAGRNADYMNILSKIDFLKNPEDPITGFSGFSGSSGSSDVRYLSGEPPILNHDVVFWLGDLNYRINDELSTEEVFQYVESGKLSELLLKEQLLLERKRGNVFHGFEEGLITFPPTYKFQAGTSFYEKRPEKKLRAPAWCDRVLWKAKIPSHVALRKYDAVMSLDLSDHKPVYAVFDVHVKHQVIAKKNQVIREIMMQLDKWENENMPRVRLSTGISASSTTSTGVVSFTHVKYGVEQQQRLIIENTGVVVAHFRFVPKLEDTMVTPPWLRLSPSYGMIPPKEKIEILIRIRVDDTTAHTFVGSESSLEDTLILRIEHGRDYFVVVSGQYDASCFGTSLEHLLACVDPIRTASKAKHDIQPLSPTQTPPSPSPEPLQKIPKELWRMMNDLYQSSMEDKTLFSIDSIGNTSIHQRLQEQYILRECLDTGHVFPPHNGYSMGELVIAWLQSLKERTVPDELLTIAIAQANGNIAQTCRILLDTLPSPRYNILIYLVSFLKELLKHRVVNKQTPEKLAIVFSRCLVTPYKLQNISSNQNQNQRERGLSTSSNPNETQPPLSSTSTASTTSTSSMASLSLYPEEKLRQSARDIEIAQSNATQRMEKMEKMLLYWLTTNSL